MLIGRPGPQREGFQFVNVYSRAGSEPYKSARLLSFGRIVYRHNASLDHVGMLSSMRSTSPGTMFSAPLTNISSTRPPTTGRARLPGRNRVPGQPDSPPIPPSTRVTKQSDRTHRTAPNRWSVRDDPIGKSARSPKNRINADRTDWPRYWKAQVGGITASFRHSHRPATPPTMSR